MSVHRLVLTEWMLRMRWPGALGGLLLVAGIGYSAAVLLPANSDLTALRDRAARAEARAAAIRAGAATAPQSAASRREQFFAALPAQDKLTQYMDQIYAAAAGEQLSLVHGEYARAEVPGAGLVRYRITLPVRGSYSQIRRFVAAAMSAVPGLALDDLNLQRQDVAESQVDERVQLSLFLVKR